MIKTISKTILLLIVLHHVNAQLIKNPKAFVSAGVFLSTSNQNPFWVRSNQYGIVPLESQVLQLRGGYKTEYDSTKSAESHRLKKKFDYAFGAELVGNIGKANQFIIPEAYFKTRLGAFEFYAGRRREIVGLVDTLLTSGSYIWSGNALPIPKIQISIPNYTSIIGKGLVSVKGTFAHGWFEAQTNSKDFFLHQKSLYGRIGKSNWKIIFYGGFNHQVQWGGKPTQPFIEPQTGKLITTYGNSLKSYLDVISGISLNTKGGADIPGIPLNDAWNRAGNHLGSIDIGAEICFSKINLLFYRQSIYEDGSLYYLNNIADGLFGLTITPKKSNHIIKFNIEFMNTTNQGGVTGSDNTIPELRGKDNYFNNALYTWVYDYQSLGTPFFSTIRNMNPIIIQKLNLEPIFILNNRVQGYTFTLQHKYNNINLISRFSVTDNYGNYSIPINESHIGLLQTIQMPYRSNSFAAVLSYDSKGLYKSGLGIFLSIKRRF